MSPVSSLYLSWEIRIKRENRFNNQLNKNRYKTNPKAIFLLLSIHRHQFTTEVTRNPKARILISDILHQFLPEMKFKVTINTKLSDSLGHGQAIWTWFNGIICWHLHHPLPERSFYPGRPKRWFRWSWFPLGHQCTWSIALPGEKLVSPITCIPKATHWSATMGATSFSSINFAYLLANN